MLLVTGLFEYLTDSVIFTGVFELRTVLWFTVFSPDLLNLPEMPDIPPIVDSFEMMVLLMGV